MKSLSSILLLLIAMVALQVASAQTQTNIEPLEAAYYAASSDSARIKTAVPLIAAYADANKMDLANRYCTQILALSRKFGESKELAAATMTRGYILMKNGNPKSGLIVLDDALRMARKLKSSKQIVDIANMAGTACMQLQYADRAEPYFREALAQLPAADFSDSTDMRIMLLGRISETYMGMGRSAEALPQLKERLVAELKNRKFEGATWTNGLIDQCYNQQGDFRNAFKYFNEELSLAKAHQLVDAETESMFHLANIYNTFGDYPNSVAYHNKVIERLEQTHDQEPLSATLANLAQVYAGHEQYDKAIAIYERALTIAQTMDRQNFVAAILHNIADARFRQGNDRQADSMVRLALAINEKMHSFQYITKNNYLLGEIHLAEKKYDSAHYYFYNGEQLAVQQKLQDDMALADKHLGHLYLVQAQDSSSAMSDQIAFAKQAITYLKKSETEALAAGTTNMMDVIYGYLSDAYKVVGNYKESMEYFKKATAVKDSMFSQQNAFKIARLENETSLAQKDVQLKNKEEESASLKRRQLYIIGISGGLLVLALGGILLYRNQRRRKEQLLKAEFDKRVKEVEMQALRAQMNPHFIFNCLNSINRYIVKSDAATASRYLTKFAKLIRYILDNSAATSIPLEIEREMLRLYIEMECLRFKHRFAYEVEIDEALSPDTMFIPSMLVQPYVENAIWHGLMHKNDGGHLSVHFSDAGNGMLQAVVKDDGVGRALSARMNSKYATKEKSHGMRITGDRLRIVNAQQGTEASIMVEDLKDLYGQAAGTRVTIQIPYSHHLATASGFSLFE